MADEVKPAEAAAPAAAPPESFTEKMSRHGWDKTAPHADNPDSLGAKARAEATETEPAAETEPSKTEKPKKAKADPTEAKREQLKTLIAELGMELEDNRVTVAERHALREEKRQATARLAQMEKEAMGRIEAATKAAEEARQKDAPRFDKLSAFEKAVTDGDHEAMAAAVGFKTWDELQEHFIALKADPAYKHLMAVRQKADALERDMKEKEARAAEEAEARSKTEAQQAEERANQEARANYMRGLAQKMSASTDPLVKAMHDDGAFVGAVFRVMQEVYRETGEEITPEQAIRKAAKGAQNPLMAELKRLHEKLDPIFRAPEPKTEQVATTKPTGRTPPPVKPPAASKTKMDDREWKASAAERLAAAVAQETAQRRPANGAR